MLEKKIFASTTNIKPIGLGSFSKNTPPKFIEPGGAVFRRDSSWIHVDFHFVQ
jgi:hypothetical protein